MGGGGTTELFNLLQYFSYFYLSASDIRKSFDLIIFLG